MTFDIIVTERKGIEVRSMFFVIQKRGDNLPTGNGRFTVLARDTYSTIGDI